MSKIRFRTSIALKGSALAFSLYGMAQSKEGFKMLTYFTNLSNLFVILVLAWALLHDVRAYAAERRGTPVPTPSQKLYLLKFMSLTTIVLTFLVFLLVLAPTNKNGFIGAYTNNHCGSLCVHVLTPILALLDYLLLDVDYCPHKSHPCYAAAVAYVYLALVLILHFGFGMTWGGKAAPYNFLNFAAPTGWFGFDLRQLGSNTLGIGVAYMLVLLSLLIFGIGKLLLPLAGRCARK